MATEEEAQEVAEYLNELSMRFTTLMAERHEAGAEEYGQLTFLGNDVVRMMLEELADVANYCRMQAVKLMVLQDTLEQEMRERGISTESADIEIGFAAFKGTKDVGWKR
jgi:hypothetical protein